MIKIKNVMKKLHLFVFFLGTLLIASEANATHLLGGEITWRCIPGTGQFRFYMELYRNCQTPSGGQAASWQFNTETLTISGSSRPRRANGSTISGIQMKPDSARWNNENQGVITPDCNVNGPKLGCGGGANGFGIQRFFYISDPITLRGTPPSSGWHFYIQTPCCRPDMTNAPTGAAGTSNGIVLRAAMYPDAQNSDVQNCNSSSPRFREIAANLVCRGYTFTFNHNAFDVDLDSLTYKLAPPINTPPPGGAPMAYNAPWSFNNPTPLTSQNAQNIPLSLDPLTGQMQMAVYSNQGSGTVGKYALVVQVDEWRDGRRIGSVFREIPYYMYDCTPLTGGGYNTPPAISIDNGANGGGGANSANGVIVDLTAGQKIDIPFNAQDFNISGGRPQTITLSPEGFMFANDFTDSTNCSKSVDAANNRTVDLRPCAILKNTDVSLNQTINPPRYQISDIAGISTQFIWQTGCHHVKGAATGIPGTSNGIYNFVMKVQDDNCPIPSVNYPTITVRVRDPLPINFPIMKGVSIGLDGKVTYQWAPPTDTASTFDNYQVQQTNVPDGANPAFGSLIYEPDLRRYKQAQKIFANYPIYANPQDIRNKIPGNDWYFRMKSESGCNGMTESAWSEACQVIEVDATPGGPAGPLANSIAELNWNRAKPVNAITDNLYKYESPTHYYIWKNDDVSTAAEAKRASNWIQVGDTNATTYKVPNSSCGGFVGFRIEARDTVVMLTQGERIRKQAFDTLTFSTFSTIDTILMRTPGILPIPSFDTLQVLSNGDVYFNVDIANVGTAGTFEIYDVTGIGTVTEAVVDGLTPVTTVVLPNTSTTHVGANADNGVKRYALKAIDKCGGQAPPAYNLNFRTIHTTFGVAGACGSTDEVIWTESTGFLAPISRYFVNYNNTGANDPYTQVASKAPTARSHQNPMNPKEDRYYYVQATNSKGDVSISSLGIKIADPNRRTNEVVPAPELRCIYVNNDNSVTLNWILPFDSTSNFVKYRFSYSINGSAETTYPDDVLFADINTEEYTFTLPGFDSHTDRLTMRAVSISGCQGDEPSAVKAEIDMIDLDVTANIKKHAIMSWNGTGVAPNFPQDPYRVYYDDVDENMNTQSLVNTAIIESSVDSASGVLLCDAPGYYRIEIFDPIRQCYSRSNYDSARFKDLDPGTQMVDFISVRDDNSVMIQWAREVESDIDSQWVVTQLPSGIYRDLDSLPLNPQRRYFSDPNQYLVTDTVLTLGIKANDACNNDAPPPYNFHTTMDIDAEWDACDSAFNIQWTTYKDFNVGNGVRYQVWWDTSGGTGLRGNLGVTADSSAQLKLTPDFNIGDTPKEFVFYVEARPTGTTRTDLVSQSNRDIGYAVYGTKPDFNYMHYADVADNNVVEMQLYPDLNPVLYDNLGQFIVKRGTSKDEMYAISSFNKLDIADSVHRFYDPTASTNEYSYFYEVVVENTCGNSIDTSNIARTVLLNVEADNEALTNTLRWNEYEGWDTPVRYYNIFRSFNKGNYVLHDSVASVGEGNMNIMVDDVYDEIFAVGDFCYYVVAVQGPVTNDFNIDQDLDPAFSRSNKVCVVQKPLFYVPNAFAPDGVNKVFAPQGQFVNWAFFEMAIYNRWGEQVYLSNDPSKGWRGDVEGGGEAQPGSYVYTIRFKDAEGKEHSRKGTVTLIK